MPTSKNKTASGDSNAGDKKEATTDVTSQSKYKDESEAPTDKNSGDENDAAAKENSGPGKESPADDDHDMNANANANANVNENGTNSEKEEEESHHNNEEPIDANSNANGATTKEEAITPSSQTVTTANTKPSRAEKTVKQSVKKIKNQDDAPHQKQKQQQKPQQRQFYTTTHSPCKQASTSNNNPSRAPSSNAVTTKPSSNHQTPPPVMQTPITTTTTTTTTTTRSNNVDFDNDYNSDSKDTLLTMAFNQDGGCLAVGTGSGFRICNINPFQETFRRSLGGGGGVEGGAGIAHIEMLYRTNLLALTGHSTSPHYPPNKVLIYDDHLQRTIGELSFRQKVLSTKLRRDRIVVVLRDRVYIYNFSDLALLDKVHTGDNPLGLIGISMDNGGVGGCTTGVERAEDALGTGGGGTSQRENNGLVLSCPSTQRGQVRVELYGLRRTTFVDAHESALGALALSVDGHLLATASERGTVIRLFDTRGVTIGGGGSNHGTVGGGTKQETAAVSSSVPLREFRRGVERATISCLTFSLDSNWLGCASNHGTVHIFQTHDPNNSSSADGVAAKKSKSSSMTGKAMRMLPKLVTSPKKYLMDGVHSYAQVRGVPHPQACAFVPDREKTIAVAGMDEYGNGCLLLAEFGKPSGSNVGERGVADDSEARRIGYHRFFKCKSPASQTGRRRTKSKDNKFADDAVVEGGGAYIDDAPVDMKMNDISIGDENEDHFVPIDYKEEK